MEEFSDTFNEKILALISSFNFSCVSDHSSELIIDLILVLSKHEIWNLTSVKNIVQIFNECLSKNLRVCHTEGSGITLDTSIKHHFLNEISKVGDAVAFYNFNLLECHVVNV